MKKFVILLLLLAGSLASCEKKENEPIEIPFMEYSLEETDYCWWTTTIPNKVIVINSTEELENYISCTTGVGYPEVDFSKHSLLMVFVNNVAGCNIDSRVEKLLLKQFSASRYEFFVDINPSDTGNSAPFYRSIAIVTEKLTANSKIELNVVVL